MSHDPATVRAICEALRADANAMERDSADTAYTTGLFHAADFIEARFPVETLCGRCKGKGTITGRADGGGATDGEFTYDMWCPDCNGTVEAPSPEPSTDQDETPRWLSVDDLNYRGGGKMGRRPEPSTDTLRDLVERAQGPISAALRWPAHAWHGSDDARRWLVEAAEALAAAPAREDKR